MSPRAGVLLCLLVAACLAQEITVRKVDAAARVDRESESAADAGTLSRYTRRFLGRRGDAPRYDTDPRALLRDLDRDLAEHPGRVLVFHLAELSFHRSLQHPPGSDEGLALALSAAEYAYAYLFDADLGPPASPYDRAFRWACDLYNRSLTRLVREFTERRPMRDGRAEVATLRGERQLVPGREELAWTPDEFESFLIADDYEVVGLSRLTRTDGLGVPCIALRPPPVLAERRARGRFLPPSQQAYAATVLLRFEGSLAGERSPRRVRVELYDPMRTESVQIGGRGVPLATDLTTPLAYMLSKAPLYGEMGAMLQAGEWAEHSGLYMLQPYQPGKIPVVFVHGLKSSPRRWVTLFNDLVADPVLRGRYQFWFFLYPTGNPFLYSAAVLRKSLRTARQAYDPGERDAAFSRMVVCGHSMGGLLTRTLIHDSGDRLWRRVSGTVFDVQEMDKGCRALLSEILFFEPLPMVRRVIFMATPHRGADMASGVLGKLGIALSVPAPWLVELARAAAPGQDAVVRKLTGIGSLMPESVVLREFDSWPLPAGVFVHSVIGNEDAADVPDGTDGVVPYSSSHLEGVVSEKVIHAGHSVQYCPAGIREVRRILLLHLEE